MNKALISVTLDTSHLEMSPLNAIAFSNILCMSLTPDTSLEIVMVMVVVMVMVIVMVMVMVMVVVLMMVMVMMMMMVVMVMVTKHSTQFICRHKQKFPVTPGVSAPFWF